MTAPVLLQGGGDLQTVSVQAKNMSTVIRELLYAYRLTGDVCQRRKLLGGLSPVRHRLC